MIGGKCMKEIIKKVNPCKSCLCLRCSCLLCPYEKFYDCFPTNAGCIHCMMHDNDKPVVECQFFKPRTTKRIYRIKIRRKDPYKGIAKLLVALHSEIKRLR